MKKEGWKDIFIEALTKVPNVTAACRAADISRNHAYETRNNDDEFARRWEEARLTSVDKLEAGAFTRAEDSDTLTIFLLKAHKPERYQEKIALQHSGKLEHKVDHRSALLSKLHPEPTESGSDKDNPEPQQ